MDSIKAVGEGGGLDDAPGLRSVMESNVRLVGQRCNTETAYVWQL